MDNTNMKTNDGYADAKVTLIEAVDLLKRIKMIETCLKPYSEIILEHPNITRVQYMQKTVNVLMEICKFKISLVYPHLQKHYLDCDGVEHAAAKLTATIVGLQDILEQLKDKSYFITSDDERASLLSNTKRIIQSLLLYIATQYRLERDSGTQYLPTYLYCTDNDLTYQEFMDKIQSLCKEYGAEYYIYERASAEGDAFLATYPNLYQLAEDLRYPLTKSVAQNAVDNPDTVSALQKEIERFADNIEISYSRTSPRDVLNKMEFN